MDVRRRLIVSIWVCGIAVLCILSIASASVNAAEASDREILNTAVNAYNNRDYLTAAIYLTMYVEREPIAMRTNATHANQINEALRYAKRTVSDYEAADGLRSDLRSCRNQLRDDGLASTSSGMTVAPPDLADVSSSEPTSYSLVCRGSESLRFTHMQSSMSFTFDRAGFNAGDSWQNAGYFAPGECAWLDRPVSVNEPATVLFHESNLDQELFVTKWVNGQITEVSPIAVGALQSAEWLQSFYVYNDGEGNFIATAIGDGSTVTNWMYSRIFEELAASSVHNPYPWAAEQIALTLYQEADLGSVSEALAAGDFGDRINALARDVWTDWQDLSDRNSSIDLATSNPADYDLSPFRQLTIGIIQGNVADLTQQQEEAFRNYLSRPEAADVWYNGINGVIGAVNREVYDWQ